MHNNKEVEKAQKKIKYNSSGLDRVTEKEGEKNTKSPDKYFKSKWLCITVSRH